MSSLKQRFLSGLLTFVMVFTFTLSVSAASFSDVNTGDWYYETVTTMTEKGLFKGKGNNMFCPNDTMTRAEFITVVMRALFPDADYTSQAGEPWWQGVYDNALGTIIERGDIFSYTQYLDDNITRQEMALILIRACEQMGEGYGTLVSKSRISDFDTIGTRYQHVVRVAFTKGLIAGKDTSGRFAPQDTLTRAEAATVLYRLIDSSKRVEFDDLWGTLTIYEGQARYNRNAQEGDIFIKKDGTQIILKKGPNGILGEGQGVAPDVGLLGQIGENGCDSFTYKVADYGSWYDSTGAHLQGYDYWINKSTGEGHWTKELHALAKKYPVPDRDGAYEGEVSSDPYSLWVWEYGDWSYNATKR